MSTVISGCAATMYSDGEPVARTAPPDPRNGCEETFARLLTDDLGTAEVAPPSPTPDVLTTVLDACTASDLLAADDHFAFASGGPMSRLITRRLFNGPEREEQLVVLCETPAWSQTHACETLPALDR